MAIVPLRMTTTQLDDATNVLSISFEEAPLPNDPDPANFQSGRTFTLSIPARAVQVTTHPKA